MKHSCLVYTAAMCLIVFDWQPGQSQWLRLSANRDEFYQRPAAPMHPWENIPGLYAGKDLEQGGTWLGFRDTGRWAALTNVRAPGAGPQNPRSRGELVTDFVESDLPVEDWLQRINCDDYAPFNLLAGTATELWYLSNHPDRQLRRLQAGRYSLSNAQLDSPWPKAELAKEQLAQADSGFAMLLNRRDPWPDEVLPATGVPILWERLLSAQFIIAPGYGTRCSTGILASGNDVQLQEITWNEQGENVGERSYRLAIKDR